MEISKRIFEIMDKKGISQKQLAKEVGIGQSTVSDWKIKGTDPQAKQIMSICKVLECTPYDILGDLEGNNND